jgi:hypothetical protein
VLEVPFEPEHLQNILAALPEICPQLKRLKLEMSPTGYRDVIDDPERELLFQPSGEFLSLEELRLPFTGLDCNLLVR